MEDNSFAEGLKAFFSKRTGKSQYRLSRKRAELLLILVEEYRSRVSLLFSDDIDGTEISAGEDCYLTALQWLENQANKVLKRESLFEVELNVHNAVTLKAILADNKYEPEGTELDKLLCWLYEQINKRWSDSKVADSSFESYPGTIIKSKYGKKRNNKN